MDGRLERYIPVKNLGDTLDCSKYLVIDLRNFATDTEWELFFAIERLS